MALEIVSVPCLQDNYAFLLHDSQTAETVVIDPSEAEPVQHALAERGWKLTAIWNTHHHFDHVGGNRALKRAWSCGVIGSHREKHRIPELDRGVTSEDKLALGAHPAQVIEIPGHTFGHIAFWFPEDDVLFCGDTLFLLGCGRLFEGTPEQMWESLLKLRALPPATRIYCGHEYTQTNARFALGIEPGNPAIRARAEKIDELRRQKLSTIPGVLAEERATNPFLRADDPELAGRLGLAGKDPVEIFGALRQRKDLF